MILSDKLINLKQLKKTFMSGILAPSVAINKCSVSKLANESKVNYVGGGSRGRQISLAELGFTETKLSNFLFLKVEQLCG